MKERRLNKHKQTLGSLLLLDERVMLSKRWVVVCRVVELQEQVDSAMTQLEKLRNARARQSEMVRFVV